MNPFTQEQMSYLKQLITNRNKSLRHEVSDHLDNSLPIQKIEAQETFLATQTAIVGAGSSSYVDLTGCSLELDPGTYLVWSHFESARFWNNFGAGGAANGYYLHAIWDNDNTTEYARIHGTIPMLTAADRYEVPGLVIATIELDEKTTIKLRGILNHSGGSNFATGYRWDTALYGQATRLYARRIV